MGDLGSISGLGRSPGEENSYLLQYSGLENSKDCIVHRVAKSQTRLSSFHFQSKGGGKGRLSFPRHPPKAQTMSSRELRVTDSFLLIFPVISIQHMMNGEE